MDCFSQNVSQLSPLKDHTLFKPAQFETYQMGEAIFPPEAIFSKLFQHEELMIHTPMKEREWVHKTHVTPNSILRNMNCKSPDMATLIKEGKGQNPNKELNTALNSAQQNPYIKKWNPTLNKLFNHSNTKEEHNSFYNVANESLEIFPVDTIHVFPSYSYIFHKNHAHEQTDSVIIPRQNVRQELIINNGSELEPVNKQSQSGQKCNCKNSKCLKLYCECLRRGETCNGCNCVGCENHSHSTIRDQRIQALVQNNPQVFYTPGAVDDQEPNQGQGKGCNCWKSNCLKNYCECHLQGLVCGPSCKCFDCKNHEPHQVKVKSPKPKPVVQYDEIKFITK